MLFFSLKISCYKAFIFKFSLAIVVLDLKQLNNWASLYHKCIIKTIAGQNNSRTIDVPTHLSTKVIFDIFKEETARGHFC